MPSSDVRATTEVLVVDDEEEIRELVAEFLRARGVRVTTAADGRAAIAAIEREPARFALVLADLQLPGCDGLDVLRAAKRANPSVSVVIITGYASLDSAIEAVRLGAYDYLTKPFSLGQIEVLLGRLADRAALEAENRRLLHRLDKRDEPEAASVLMSRLDGIDLRLARIEATLARRPA